MGLTETTHPSPLVSCEVATSALSRVKNPFLMTQIIGIREAIMTKLGALGRGSQEAAPPGQLVIVISQ